MAGIIEATILGLITGFVIADIINNYWQWDRKAVIIFFIVSLWFVGEFSINHREHKFIPLVMTVVIVILGIINRYGD